MTLFELPFWIHYLYLPDVVVGRRHDAWKAFLMSFVCCTCRGWYWLITGKFALTPALPLLCFEPAWCSISKESRRLDAPDDAFRAKERWRGGTFEGYRCAARLDHVADGGGHATSVRHQVGTGGSRRNSFWGPAISNSKTSSTTLLPCISLYSAGWVVPVARCSARDIAWHRWEQPVAAVREVVPVVAILPAFPAGIYRHYRRAPTAVTV